MGLLSLIALLAAIAIAVIGWRGLDRVYGGAQPAQQLVGTGRQSLGVGHEGGRSRHRVAQLRGHVARANPLWRELGSGVEALAIFHGPQHYISPSWYPAKREHGRVVPTWNYAVVHAHGRLQAIDDPAWLRGQIAELTAGQEAAQAHPWAVGDAPADYIEGMLKGIVGIELVISRLEGKWKASQNQSAANRHGVLAGLLDRDGDEAAQMAVLLRAQGLPASD